MLSLKESIESRGSLYQSDKCLMVMSGMYDYAIDRELDATSQPCHGVEAGEVKAQTQPQPFLGVGAVTQVF